MKLPVFPATHYLQILWPVVVAIAVNVVNHFIALQEPPKLIFHHYAVLQYIPLARSLGVLWKHGV